MRWVAFLFFLSFSTAALALDDCNAKFPNTGQLADRLKFLQSNNNSLQSQVDALKVEIGGYGGKHAIAKPMGTPSARAQAKPNKAHVPTPQPLLEPIARGLACNGIAMPTCAAVGRKPSQNWQSMRCPTRAEGARLLQCCLTPKFVFFAWQYWFV